MGPRSESYRGIVQSFGGTGDWVRSGAVCRWQEFLTGTPNAATAVPTRRLNRYQGSGPVTCGSSNCQDLDALPVPSHME